jgi:hypothetical protein
MTLPDQLNFAGIVITGIGSSLAMFGVYNQMNGYFAFKPSKLFDELRRIIGCFLIQGKAAGMKRIQVAAELSEGKIEDRAKSLIGFYCVLFGFFFQMLGSVLLVAALFAGSSKPAS